MPLAETPQRATARTRRSRQLGDVTIAPDVNVGVAAAVAANMCNIDVGPVTALAQQVDATGTAAGVYTTGGQAVTLVQNA